MATASKGLTRRTRRRLAYVRVRKPGALPRVNERDGLTVGEARRTKRKYTSMKQRQAEKKAAKQYSPLSPLTGQREKEETKAATQLEFGDRERALRDAVARQQQTQANTGNYYDDYRKALAEASARVNAANAEHVTATEGRVDSAYSQDKSAVQARDAQASATAAKLGRGPVQSNEGARAVEAARSQGNQSAARLRERASSDTRYMEVKGATSVLAKSEAMQRENARRRKLGEEEADLAADKGAFKTDLRRRNRQDEREWAAIQKEFGLKEKELKIDKKASRADRQLERQKLNAQKIVARMYASADRAGARAQVRVAKLQMEKGKIDASQYKTIRNIYEGLPGGGSTSGGGKSNKGSGANGKLLPWEKDKIDLAIRSLESANATAAERRAMIDRLVKRGDIPARLARIAWQKYANRNFGTQVSRPHDSQQP